MRLASARRNSECCSFDEGRAFRIGAIHNATAGICGGNGRREPLIVLHREHPLHAHGRDEGGCPDRGSDGLSSLYRARYGVVMLVELAGVRTFLAVPMLKDDEVVGAIAIYRQEVLTIHRQADRAGAELRRPGRHRHREHAAAQ